MARVLSTDLQTILAGDVREIVWTVDITFPTIAPLSLASEPIDITKGTYSNDLNDTSEIRLTTENPVDRVSLAFQNVDSILGQHVADNLTEWQAAEAVVGRLYRGSGLEEWVPMFKGVVSQPDVNDLQVTFDVLSDLIAPGPIVCNRTLAPPCGFKFKDTSTCGYSGIAAACNHHLKSKLGCDGLGNSHRFGGMESRYNPDASVPGSGNNNPNGGGGGGGCPRLDQWVLVEKNNEAFAKRVSDLTLVDRLFNPTDQIFHPIRSLAVIRDVSIWEIVSKSGHRSLSSATHKLLRDSGDRSGQRVTFFWFGDSVLCLTGRQPSESRISFARQIPGLGDVLRIEMASGHIYAAGSEPDKLIVAHNTKNPVDGEIIV